MFIGSDNAELDFELYPLTSPGAKKPLFAEPNSENEGVDIRGGGGLDGDLDLDSSKLCLGLDGPGNMSTSLSPCFWFGRRLNLGTPTTSRHASRPLSGPVGIRTPAQGMLSISVVWGLLSGPRALARSRDVDGVATGSHPRESEYEDLLSYGSYPSSLSSFSIGDACSREYGGSTGRDL